MTSYVNDKGEFKIRKSLKGDFEIKIAQTRWLEVKRLNEIENAISHYFCLDKGFHIGRLRRNCPLCRSD